MTYGVEACQISDDVSKTLDGANPRMISVIPVESPHVEDSQSSRKFDLSIRIIIIMTVITYKNVVNH